MGNKVGMRHKRECKNVAHRKVDQQCDCWWRSGTKRSLAAHWKQ